MRVTAMINMILLSLMVRFSITANRLIHFLRHIPLIKEAISPSLYREYSLKTVFAVFGILFIATKKIIYRLFYVAFVVALGIITCQIAVQGGFSAFFNNLSNDNPFVEMIAKEVVFYILSIWFILSFIGGISGARIIGTSYYYHDNTMINHLHADPAIYAKSQIVLGRAADIILYLPYILVAFMIAGIPLWETPVILAVFTAFRLLGEAINLLLYRYIHKHFGNPPLSFSLLFLFLAAVVIPVWLGIPNLADFLQNPFVLAGTAAIGIAAVVYIMRYPRYAPLFKERISTIEKAMENAKKRGNYINGTGFQSVKNWRKGLKQEDLQLELHSGKTGFAYLNAIFFERHRKYFKKSLLIRCSIILGAGLIISTVAIIYMTLTGNPISTYLYESHDAKSIFNLSSVFFFIIYIASMGRIVTAGVFSNCDIQMLHYPYYRTKETIMASFKSRFLFILQYNLIITFTLSLASITSAGLLFWHFDYAYSLILFVLLNCIGVFFAFNDLFLYYVIQPYDTAGKSKSIIYSIINSIVYLIAYFGLQVRFDFVIYSIIVIAATILYLGLGTGLLLRFAPKNFKLR